MIADQIAGRYGRRIGIAALTVPAVILVVAGCGAAHARTSASSGSSRRPSASPSPSVDYGEQFLADLTPVGNAGAAVGRARTNQQNIRGYRRLSRVEQSTSAEMLRQTWPASAEADVQAYAEQLSVESGDDGDVSGDFKIDPTAYSTRDKVSYNPNASSMGNDLSRENSDYNKLIALATKCRADLGLPPAS